jgi:hypothetical protein
MTRILLALLDAYRRWLSPALHALNPDNRCRYLPTCSEYASIAIATHGPAWMEDQIAALRKQIHMAAQGLAHAALDAVAVVSPAQHLAGGEPDARARREGDQAFSGLLRQKPAHGARLALAAGSIGALIVGVLAEARICEANGTSWQALKLIGRDVHEIAEGVTAGACRWSSGCTWTAGVSRGSRR